MIWLGTFCLPRSHTHDAGTPMTRQQQADDPTTEQARRVLTAIQEMTDAREAYERELQRRASRRFVSYREVLATLVVVAVVAFQFIWPPIEIAIPDRSRAPSATSH